MASGTALATAAKMAEAAKMKKHAPETGQLVISALEDPRYEWRSIEGVSLQTGLSEDQVRRIIVEMGDKIVRSSIPDDKGRSLYTTREYYRKTHGIGARLLNALADKVA